MMECLITFLVLCVSGLAHAINRGRQSVDLKVFDYSHIALYRSGIDHQDDQTLTASITGKLETVS